MIGNRIALVASDKKMAISYKQQLEEIFDKDVEVVLRYIDDSAEKLLGFDLILVASTMFYDVIKEKAPLNVPVLRMIRNINVTDINKLINVEERSRALVVSYSYESSQETIRLLQELGLNNMTYIAYSPDCPGASELTDKVDMAITAGAVECIPRGISKYIDLGYKIIDISTIIEIMIILGLPIERINILTLRYLKGYMALSRTVDQLKSTLIAVLNSSSEGIMALDEKNNISFKNDNIHNFIGNKQPIMVGENISKYISNNKALAFINDGKTNNNEIFQVNNADILIKKSTFRAGDKTLGRVLNMSFVSELQNMEKEVRNKLSTKGNVAKYDFHDIIGQSKSLRQATDISRRAAKSDLSVLILGENGTGKELFAQAIHENSPRKNGPFVAANFAALSETLIESELFGYEEGAFTGAKKGGKPGLFELAHLATIFQDQIGDASPSIQSKLLRVIQEKEVLRVGGISPISVDVRVIAATNRNLKRLINDNLFRKDLYYRLNTITIKVPPLRERKEDIPDIIDYYNRGLHKKKRITSEAFDILLAYDWPGNVRELQNLTLYLSEIVEGDIVTPEDLPLDILDSVNNQETFLKEEKPFKMTETVMNDNPLVKEILSELCTCEKNYKRASRAYLQQCLSRKDIPISINVLRGVLTELDALELIQIRSTKQGTVITPKGKAFLKKLKEFCN